MTSDRAIADALPGYEIGAELGRGAMGEVLAARHRKLDRAVAVKRLPEAFSYVADVRQRFAEEAKVLATLSHPHVVPVYDYVEDEGLCLLVMQALGGGTVWDRFSGDGLTMAEACAVAVATCAGMHHAHEKRIVHRDIKPENLMFDDDDVLKVTDFGIAAALGGDRVVATLDGVVIGTPAYMAPEQAAGEAAGPFSDVYAAGTMLYELLSGVLPFDEGAGPADLLRARVDHEPRPILDVADQVPPVLADVVMTAIARDPADRYATAEAFGIALSQAASDAWGPGWMDQTGLSTMTGGALAAATATGLVDGRRGEQVEPPASTAPAVGADDPMTEAATARAVGAGQVPDGAGTPRSGGRATRLAGDEAPAAPAPARATTAAPRVRATRGPAEPVDLRAIDPREVVRIDELLTPPPVPTRSLVATAVAAALLLVMAVGGVAGRTGPATGEAATSMTLDGAPLTSGLEVDLGRASTLAITDPPTEATTVQLSMTALGLGPWSSDLAPLEADVEQATATIHTQAVQRIASGPVRADVVLRDADGEVVGREAFRLHPSQRALASAAGVGSLAVVVLAVLYAWGASTPLRLGRRVRSAAVGLAASGAVAGVGLSLLGWSAGAAEPSLLTVVVCGVLGAVAGWFGADVVFALGRRRRLRRAGVAG